MPLLDILSTNINSSLRELKRASDKIFIDYLNAHEKYGAKIESESETIVDVIDEELISVYFIRDSLKMS